jgi:hypothetical protein
MALAVPAIHPLEFVSVRRLHRQRDGTGHYMLSSLNAREEGSWLNTCLVYSMTLFTRLVSYFESATLKNKNNSDPSLVVVAQLFVSLAKFLMVYFQLVVRLCIMTNFVSSALKRYYQI